MGLSCCTKRRQGTLKRKIAVWRFTTRCVCLAYPCHRLQSDAWLTTLSPICRVVIRPHAKANLGSSQHLQLSVTAPPLPTLTIPLQMAVRLSAAGWSFFSRPEAESPDGPSRPDTVRAAVRLPAHQAAAGLHRQQWGTAHTWCVRVVCGGGVSSLCCS